MRSSNSNQDDQRFTYSVASTFTAGAGGLLSWSHWRFISQLMKKNSHARNDWDLPPASSGLILSRLNILLILGDLISVDDG